VSKTLVIGPTYREIEVACEVAKGRTFQEAATALGISVGTVKSLLHKLRVKRGAGSSTVNLIAMLIRDRYIVFGRDYDVFLPNTDVVHPWKNTR